MITKDDLTSNEKERLEKLVIPAEEHYRELATRAPDYSLLGNLLWWGSLVLIVAETSAGKTVLSHRLCRCLATGEPFLGMTTTKPLHSLLIDLESPEPSKLITLEHVPPAPGWDDTRIGIRPQEAQWLASLGLWDVIVVDNLQTVYPVDSENDNAEAIEQMNFFAQHAKVTGSCIIVLHNTGKSDHQRDILRSRGALSRVDRADLCITIKESDGDCTLIVAKSRFGNKGETIKYRWAEDYNYTVISHTFPKHGRRRSMEDQVFEVMAEGLIKRADIAARLSIVSGSPRDKLLTRALKALIKQELIHRPKHGHYQKGSGK